MTKPRGLPHRVGRGYAAGMSTTAVRRAAVAQSAYTQRQTDRQAAS